jgi:hypothetical protein
VTASPEGSGWIGSAGRLAGLGVVRAALDVRGGFAAAFPACSAFSAAWPAVLAGDPPESRFGLRLPGRELGRFPSTPPSSAMDGDSRPDEPGYTAGVGAVDRFVRSADWLTG